jgi:hypothetical protein
MRAPHLNIIFADYEVPYSGRCRKATECHGGNIKVVNENIWEATLS